VLDYFHEYISPASEKRAKISVHMRAHPKPVELDGESDADATELDKLTIALCKLLKGQGLPADSVKLKARLEQEIPELVEKDATESSPINPEDVVEVIGTYLVEDEGVDEDDVDEMEENATPAVAGILKRIGGGPEEVVDKPAEDEGPKEHYVLSKIKPRKITTDEVLAFKSSMQATKGTWGFKDVKEFEDVEPKL
jgi:hypothetical protein